MLETTWPGGLQAEHQRFAQVLAQFDNGLAVLDGLMLQKPVLRASKRILALAARSGL